MNAPWRPAALHLARRLAIAALLGAAIAGTARAQRPAPVPADTGQGARVTVVGADTTRAPTPEPPISPRRAFIYSLLAPGSSQVILGRPSAAGLFVLAEAIALVMVRESAAEVRDARTLLADSLVTSFTADGRPVYGPGPVSRNLVRARRAHLEDWIAVLLFNHLFSGADGFVAAQLWDVPLQVGGELDPDRRFRVVGRLRW